MRKFLAVLLFAGLGTAAWAQTTITPESLLNRGVRAYKSGDFSSAVTDLQAAAQGFLSPEQMQAYVNTGRFERLQAFETALVYLALSQSRLGREDDARETLLRLQSAERINPTYTTLRLGADAAEIESLSAALTPSHPLPRNQQLADDDSSGALPAITPKERVAVKKTIVEEREERQALIDEIVARERERIQREADLRIASERQQVEKQAAQSIAETQRAADARVAAASKAAQEELARLQAETDKRIAAAEAETKQREAAASKTAEEELARLRADTNKRIATAETDAKQRVAAAEQASEAQIAAARREAEQRAATVEAEAKQQAEARIAEIQKLTEARIVEERAAADRAATARVTEAETAARKEYLMALRTAEAAVGNSNVPEAVRIYSGLANSTGAPREVLAEAAVGLYRTGAFREAVQAFKRFGTFARGEEDLRYYHAVALYETGAYVEAQKELACALPFIQVTEDVTRYRVKIENTIAQSARK
ncbi:MAG TPA: hypothetical protein VNI54_12935 [Thermoanaerobaculia bacterium]|nr:hypothetical protein [Thermoanaerobaculia bacterium]